MSIQPWKVISSKRDKSYRVFSLRTDTARSPRTGREHDFYILESSSWVNVIPITAQGEVVLVRQYRHGIQDITLEIPGGLVESHETPEQAAGRELLEETGYGASEMICLGSVYPNPAIQNNRCYFYLARHASLVGTQQQDEREDIEIQCRPLSEIPGLIRKGELAHSLVLVAFFMLFQENEIGKDLCNAPG